MLTTLKIKNVSVKKLACGDMSYQVLLEGIEGGDYSKEMAELIRLQEKGDYIQLKTIEPENITD